MYIYYIRKVEKLLKTITKKNTTKKPSKINDIIIHLGVLETSLRP